MCGLTSNLNIPA